MNNDCNFFLFDTAVEELGGIETTLPSAPTPLSQYPKLCELRRKFPVLYRVEFQVNYFSFICLKKKKKSQSKIKKFSYEKIFKKKNHDGCNIPIYFYNY